MIPCHRTTRRKYRNRWFEKELWKEAGQTEEKVKAIRQAEGEEAATILGASFEGMDLGDYPLELDQAAMERLTTAIREFAPTVILTHTKEDPFNPDHGVAYFATEKARQLSSGAGVAKAFKTINPPALLLFEPHQPELCGVYPNTFLDITPVFQKKRAAMNVMGAQGYLHEYYSQRANHARRICGAKEIKFAEAFGLRDALTLIEVLAEHGDRAGQALIVSRKSGRLLKVISSARRLGEQPLQRTCCLAIGSFRFALDPYGIASKRFASDEVRAKWGP